MTVHHHVQCCDVEFLPGGGARLSLQRTSTDVVLQTADQEVSQWSHLSALAAVCG